MAANIEELEKRAINLETQIAFLQVTVDELNSVVTKQQDVLDNLVKQFKELATQLKESMIEKDNVTKPPHY